MLLLSSFPIGAEAEFTGIIDLITMQAETYDDALGKEIEVGDIPWRYVG
jgi:elongation factor G